jgi:NAD(P)-dependent dehydrogenase (short-subunit alcohol dehydrogenase family)
MTRIPRPSMRTKTSRNVSLGAENVWVSKQKIGDNTEKREVSSVKIPVQFPEGNIPLTGKEPGRAEDVAELICFLASDHARHISGSEIYIDGAESLLQG